VKQLFSDAVRECLDRLYSMSGDETVRLLYYAADKVDLAKSREDKWRRLSDFATLVRPYLEKYGGNPEYRDVFTCITVVVVAEIMELLN